MLPHDLIHTILQQFALPHDGEHGVRHWARVLENGLRLAAITGANPAVVALFAVIHDSHRLTDGDDPLHGLRAAEYAATLRGGFFDLSDVDFARLHVACAYHADGLTESETTVQTCWDADRLDLGRGGITPDPRYLCTAAAKQPGIIAWATQRAEQDYAPSLIYDEWAALPAPADRLLG
jgi:uncharacterized protein